jgi:hypothetical protein
MKYIIKAYIRLTTEQEASVQAIAATPQKRIRDKEIPPAFSDLVFNILRISYASSLSA